MAAPQEYGYEYHGTEACSIEKVREAYAILGAFLENREAALAKAHVEHLKYEPARLERKEKSDRLFGRGDR